MVGSIDKQNISRGVGLGLILIFYLHRHITSIEVFRGVDALILLVYLLISMNKSPEGAYIVRLGVSLNVDKCSHWTSISESEVNVVSVPANYWVSRQ
jgi:hypothetical protein